VVAWQAAAVRAHLERFLVADDVELEQPADEQPLLSLAGPLANAIAAEALGVPALPPQPFDHARLTFQSLPVRVIVASECDGTGVLLCGPAAAAAGLFDACCEAGARPLGMTALDTLRVEAGVPWAGVDMDDSVLLQETGRDAAISFSKGCYLGQEVVERIAARGHVNRHLAGVRCAGERIPAPRTPLIADGRDVGYVTSGVRAGTAGRPIALALINRKFIEPGQSLLIGSGAEAIAAVVSRLPFDLAEIE
jgi:folate-binding protein YgfZ